MARARIRIARNFDRNLDQIAGHLGEAVGAFDALLAHLFDAVIPNLERFPRVGVDFLGRTGRSTETRALKRRLLNLVPRSWELREYIAGDYLILYLVHATTVELLSIRHHLQLSFDLKGHWGIEPR
jgi:ParE toxin of type II toxin-antitoxin system, parDE